MCERDELLILVDKIKKNKQALSKELRQTKYKKAWDKLLNETKAQMSKTIVEELGFDGMKSPASVHAFFDTCDVVRGPLGKAVGRGDVEMVEMILDDMNSFYIQRFNKEYQSKTFDFDNDRFINSETFAASYPQVVKRLKAERKGVLA